MHDNSDQRPSAGDHDAPPDATEQDLKATADSIRTDLSRLAAIEDEKSTLDGEFGIRRSIACRTKRSSSPIGSAARPGPNVS